MFPSAAQIVDGEIIKMVAILIILRDHDDIVEDSRIE